MNLQILKKAMIAYVNSFKLIWSELAHPLTIFSKNGKSLKDYRIYGESIQDGTPTPEAPVEIQSVGEHVTEGEYAGKYKIPVVARGKNLCSNEHIHYTTYYNYTVENGNVNAYGATLMGFICKVEPLTTYTVSFNVVDYEREISMRVREYSEYPTGWETNIIKQPIIKTLSGIGIKTATFTTTETAKYAVFGFFNVNGTANVNNFMMVEGDTEAECEPYIEPQTFNIHLDEPLRKVGEYADYIDFEKGVVVRRIKERTIGSYRWDKYSNHTDQNSGVLLYRYEYPISDKRLFIGGYGAMGALLCTGLRHTHYNYGVIDKSISERPYDTGQRSIRILTSQYGTVAAMKEAFGDFKFYYILDDAYITEEKVTLPALPTFKGTTIYEVQTDTPPSGIEVCYYE